jgi:hypothetical protein
MKNSIENSMIIMFMFLGMFIFCVLLYGSNKNTSQRAFRVECL